MHFDLESLVKIAHRNIYAAFQGKKPRNADEYYGKAIYDHNRHTFTSVGLELALTG